VRAEPVALLYEQGKVRHVGAFPELEDQLCVMRPDSFATISSGLCFFAMQSSSLANAILRGGPPQWGWISLAPIERANVAAARAGLTSQVVKVRCPAPDLDAAFKEMASKKAQALVVLEVPVTIPLRKRIAELAAEHRIPIMFWGAP